MDGWSGAAGSRQIVFYVFVQGRMPGKVVDSSNVSDFEEDVGFSFSGPDGWTVDEEG